MLNFTRPVEPAWASCSLLKALRSSPVIADTCPGSARALVNSDPVVLFADFKMASNCTHDGGECSRALGLMLWNRSVVSA